MIWVVSKIMLSPTREKETQKLRRRFHELFAQQYYYYYPAEYQPQFWQALIAGAMDSHPDSSKGAITAKKALRVKR
jgi:hypothetical protein